MRTIKFRVWNKSIYKHLLESTIFSLDNTGWININKETNGGIDEFTGLQDCKGKDIYEGDIVKLKENEYYFERSGEVIFEEGTFKIKNVELWNDGTYNHYSLEILDTEFCEIIGNIHENKELITNK